MCKINMRTNLIHMNHIAFSCRWPDKLGLAAQLGHKVVVRQTFFNGNYAMVNKHLKPNPVST